MIQVQLLHLSAPAEPHSTWLPALPPVGSTLTIDGVTFAVLGCDFAVETHNGLTESMVTLTVRRGSPLVVEREPTSEQAVTS